ncbi:hypothetical protein B0E33_11375 [Roseibium algicola]|uniref:Prepilin-type N-terminal cleavage/methylation domain-containing protein n=1 Tax=Roseibium algicola TaxID=2857014 RepID=A0ABN4WUR7_9HYPH|nr:hypothetical protein B0E33_11375 [Roseibium aggregatum]
MQLNLRFRAENGFSLIELSIVLIIFGVLAASLANLYATYLEEKRTRQNLESISAAYEAIVEFQRNNGHYPCPARPSDAQSRASDCSSASPTEIKTVSGTDGRVVRIGTFPLISQDGGARLLPGHLGIDGSGNRLSYAVTEVLAQNSETFDANLGAIRVIDQGNNTLTINGHFVVLSHGDNKAGAYTREGKQAWECDTNTADGENCDNNATFVSTAERSFAEGIYYNDDYLEYAANTAKTLAAGQLVGSIQLSAASIIDLTALGQLKNALRNAEVCSNVWGDASCVVNDSNIVLSCNKGFIRALNVTNSSGLVGCLSSDTANHKRITISFSENWAATNNMTIYRWDASSFAYSP